MKNASVASLLCLFSALVSLTGCPSPKGPEDKPRIIRVKGNPIAFVAQTKGSGNIPLPASLFQAGSKWHVEMGGFAEGSAEVNYDKAVAEQNPIEKSNEEKVMEAFATQFTTSLNGPSVELRGKVGKSEFGFDFAISGGQANLTALFAGNRIPVGDFLKVIHVSLRPDQNAFSLLLFYDVPKQRTLVAFYLSRVNATKPQVDFTNEPYNYLFGRGTKIGWSKDGPLKISACGTAPSELEDMIGKAAKQWQSVLESRLTLQTVPTVDCPPFSDLNTRGVYYVASWIEAAGPDVSVTGQTAPVPDFEHGILMDGDIFILTGEFQEMLNRYLPGQNMNSPDTLDFLVKAEIASTMLHEMGHLLGLHHQFDPKISSIMSYVDNPNALTDYDAKAVQTLYSK